MATKKATSKKAPAKKSSKRSKKSENYVSFKLQPNDRPFIQFRLSRQTLYWTVLSLIILALGTYVVYLQTEISNIYDQVNAQSLEVDAAEVKPAPKKQ